MSLSLTKWCRYFTVMVIRRRGIFYGDKESNFEVDKSVFFLDDKERFNDTRKLKTMVTKYN